MKLEIAKGSTSYILSLFISDSSSTTGAGLAGLLFNSAGLTAKYKRQGEAGWSTINLVTATEGTYTSSGFIEDDIAIGNYELGLPNAIIALGNGVEWVRLMLNGATNMAPLPLEIQLVDTIGFDKNTLFNNFMFPMYNSNGVLTSGLTVTATRSIDGAAFAGAANAVVEIGSGAYKINLAASDLNGNNILFEFAAAGARTTSITIVTNR